MCNSFFSRNELDRLGFKHLGSNVLLSRKTSIYGASTMVMGNNVRIDDYTFLSGHIIIGDHVHISAYSSLVAGDSLIQIKSFSGLSSRVSIYAISDDYSGEYLTNPTIPKKFKRIETAEVIIEKHAIIGTGCTILPGAHINKGVAVGAMSLVMNETEPWSIYAGVPIKKIRNRSKNLLQLETLIHNVEVKKKTR